jgi:ATP-dependent exoDNAse (exonuclease V) beta subunit
VAGRLAELCAAQRRAAADLLRHADDGSLPLLLNARKALVSCLESRDADLPPRSDYLRKACLDDLLTKAGKGRTSAEAQAAYAALRAATLRLDEQGVFLRGTLRLMPFCRLARLVGDELAAYLQRQNAMPAWLIPGLARHALAGGHGVSGALCRLGANLTHILIDEFQDTSLEQWLAIHPLVWEALANGGSFIWVGDVKQAIYGWRGGDATLFSRVADDGDLRRTGGRFRTDSLPMNRRSCAAVVRANNSLFAQLADRENALDALNALLPRTVPPPVIARTAGRVAATFADAAQQIAAERTGGFVRLDRLDVRGQALRDETALARLSGLVRELASRRPLGEITVLVRSNDQAALAASRLLADGIAVVTESSLLLAEHPLIAQCVAFLRWLHNPRDDKAFWTILAGPRLLLPLREISRQRLEDWLAGRDRHLPLPVAFGRSFPDHWSCLSPFYQRAGLLTPYDAVSEMLARWRVAQRLPDDAAFIRRFLEILYRAEQNGALSAGAFLEYWDVRGREEKAPMPDNVEAVRVMTMHKAKGLQFRIVVVPWNDSSPRVDPVPVELELDGLRLFAPLGRANGEAYYSALAETAAESLNLLYVAWTRAEECLYAFLHSDSAGLGAALDGLLQRAAAAPASPWRKEGTSFLAGHDPCAERNDAADAPLRAAPATEEGAAAAGRERAGGDGADEPDPDADASWRPMDWLPRLKILRSGPETIPSISGRRGLRGRFIHACLEHFATVVRASPPEADVTSLASEAVALAAARSPFPPDPLWRPEARACLEWFAAVPWALPCLRCGWSEQPLLDGDGSLYRPDLVAPEYAPDASPDAPPEAWLAVEYKTGRPADGHLRQIARYARLLGQAYGRPARGMLVYLDERAIRAVRAGEA